MLDFVITAQSLRKLRLRLDTAGPGAAAQVLQEAGFATGEALFPRWQSHVTDRTGLTDPRLLDAEWFGPLLDELTVTLGWGSLTVTSIGDRGLLFEAGQWAESEPGTSEHAACHFSCGCLAAFLTAQAGSPIAVLEVECRSRGDHHCRFLAGSAETLAVVYDLVAAGRSWTEGVVSA